MTIHEAFPEMLRLVGKVRFSPTDTEVVMSLALDAVKFADNPDRLRLLVDAFINEIGEWHGIKEFRGVWCTRWKPADGVECFSTIPGFTGDDSENGTASRALDGPAELARLIEAAKPVTYSPLPAGEIRANENQIAEVEHLAQHRHELPRAEAYEVPDYLKNLVSRSDS